MYSMLGYEGYMNFSFPKEGPYQIGDSVEVVITSSMEQKWSSSDDNIYYLVSKYGFKAAIGSY